MKQNPIAAVAKRVDETITMARQQSAARGHPVVLTCTKGCSACCQELLLVTTLEVEWILEGMSEEQKEELKPRVQAWLDAVNANGLYEREEDPDAHEYRSWRIPCPLLKGNLCSVYERRPLGCRFHMTHMPRIGCEDLELRRKQKFIEIPELKAAMCQWVAKAHTNSEHTLEMHMGHMGTMLAHQLGVGVVEIETFK